MTLEGSIAQRLDQLDRRETELLEDAEKQRKLIKQLKEERGHYRKKAEEREYVLFCCKYAYIQVLVYAY